MVGREGVTRLRAPGFGAAPTDDGPQRSQRVVGDLPRPHQVPQRDEQLDVGGIERRHRVAQGAPETGAASRQQTTDGVVQWTGRRFEWLPAGSEQRQLVGEAQPDPAVLRTDRPGADPDDLARCAQLVEHRRPVPTHPGRQHIGLERRGHDRGSGQHPQRLDERLLPAPIGGDAVPRRKEAGVRRSFDRLDLSAQRRQRSAPQLAQHVDVAPLTLHALRAELALHDALVGCKRHDRARDPLGGRAEPASHVVDDERPMRPCEPADELFERPRDRLGERHRQAERERAPQPVAIAGRVLGRRMAGLTADGELDHPSGA